MIDIGGISLDENYSWINKDHVDWKKKKKIRGVIFLVSTQNVSRRWDAWQKMVKALNPLPEKVIFCENDSTDDTVNLIREWDFPHELITFKTRKSKKPKSIYEPIARNRQKLLNRARKIKPKFAIFLDDDVFPDDQDLITRLTKHNLLIVSGTYLRPFGDKGVFIASKWHVDMDLKDFPRTSNLKEKVKNAKKFGGEALLFSGCDPKLYKVYITSAGCLCLCLEVLQNKKLNFHPIYTGKYSGGKVSEDFGYCLKARELGYKIYLDGNTRLAHLKPTPDRKRPWAY